MVSCLLFVSIDIASADVKLPAIISDHMVLLKSERATIWGTAAPGEEVTVTLDKATGKTTAGSDGKWKLDLNLKNSAQGPFTMTVQGKNTLTISDVLVGEVWLAGGQSNMAFTLLQSLDGAAEVAASTNPLIREFQAVRIGADTPAAEVAGKWVPSDPSGSGTFSAVAYYFAKRLNNELKVPVGIINANVGGTEIEVWMSPECIQKLPVVAKRVDTALQYRKDYPGLFEAYKKNYPAWMKQTGREDHPPGDVKTFAEDPIPAEGWLSIPVGTIKADKLPANGVVWLRKEIDIPDTVAGKAVGLTLGPVEGFQSVYWNGKLIKQVTPENNPGTLELGYTVIPGEYVKAGKNTFAIRIFAPGMPLELTRYLVCFKQILGNWSAKVEYVLPMLAAEQLASMPKLPDLPVPAGFLPGGRYNAMIHPLKNYAIRGMLWYQGEYNISYAYAYRTLFPALITDWRAQWGRGDLPFYFCQLPAFRVKTDSPDPDAEGWTVLRESQTKTLQVPKTGEAVLIDLGDSNDIHPPNKKPVGDRLAVLALANDYGKKVPTSGPVYESSKFEKGIARVKFSHAEGLVARPLPATYSVAEAAVPPATAPLVRNSPNGELEGFALCGEDKKWYWADAKVEGDSVIVWSDKVPTPIAVRYAWVENPTVNLYNSAGLPAVPFRTDDFAVPTQPKSL
ncbi:MAG: sialate O-acetylesterase [Chthoniobacterales bacterium]